MAKLCRFLSSPVSGSPSLTVFPVADLMTRHSSNGGSSPGRLPAGRPHLLDQQPEDAERTFPIVAVHGFSSSLTILKVLASALMPPKISGRRALVSALNARVQRRAGRQVIE